MHHINFKTSDFCGVIELCNTKAKGKSVFKHRKKNQEATRLMKKVNVWAFSIPLPFLLRQMLNSLVLFNGLFCLFFLCFSAITVVPTFAGRDSEEEGSTDCNYWSVSTSTKISKTKSVRACMFEAL